MQLLFSQQLMKIVQAQCEDTNTPRSLAIWLLAKNGEYIQLFSMKSDPANYLDAQSFFKDNQVTEFLRKLELDVPGIDKEAAAHRLFYQSEHQCYRTNQRLMRFESDGPFERPSDLRLSEFFVKIRQKIATILGPIPSQVEARHGPGGTFADKGRLTTVPDKMSSRPTISQSAVCLVPLWERTAWALALMKEKPSLSAPEVVRGNRFTTVSKDATKHRGICIEPSLNIFFQLGVGGFLRGRLKLHGIDLEHGQDVHRKIAQRASQLGDFATIDLSNASDTVAYNLCKLCLPGNWFDLLNSLRSSHTFFKGKWIKLEKFASMGNGYTFELETLLFLAITEVTAEDCGLVLRPGKDVWVYGDDIIVPTEVAEFVLKALEFSGFTPNIRKTFLEGNFRESCGGDFFLGTPVRAHYLKEDPYEPQHFIALANGIRRVVNHHTEDIVYRRLYRRSWLRCLDALPSSIRSLRGPEELGDLVIHDDQWEIEVRACRGRVRGYAPISRPIKWDHWSPMVTLASALYGCDQEGVIPRDSVSGYRIKWVATLSRPPGYPALNG